MGPTPTPTLGMRLSCNFVNVYTIAYRVYTVHAYMCMHACIPNRHPREDPREETRVSDKSARILVRVARMSARMSVSVSVSVPWNSRYTTPEIHCRHRRHECEGGITWVG